jgi:hypothetical protein
MKEKYREQWHYSIVKKMGGGGKRRTGRQPRSRKIGKIGRRIIHSSSSSNLYSPWAMSGVKRERTCPVAQDKTDVTEHDMILVCPIVKVLKLCGQ